MKKQRNHYYRCKTAGICLGAVVGGIFGAQAAGESVTNSPASPGAASATSATNAPTPAVATKASVPFWKRLGEAFHEQLGAPAYTPPDPNAPPPPRRGLPAPFDAPPFPDGEWQLGGTETIGDPMTLGVSPLMQALYDGPHGQSWKDSGVHFYGWLDFSGNLSTSDKSNPSSPGPGGNAGAPGANFPLAYDQRPNRMELNQAVLYVERTADEFQTDHIDWGFRVSAVYGLDYSYMISKGLFASQILRDHHWYGYDMPMMYGTIYIPNVAMGMNITFGRVISEADIEAQLAPNNLMSSHSLLYAFDPYTQEGIFSTIKLNKNWIIQAGIANGGDVAIWEKDPGNQPTGTVMVQYQSSNGKFSFYGGANQFNNGEWGYNNLQQYVGTLSYKFNEKIWTSWESWYMYQFDAKSGPTASVPNINGNYPQQVHNGYAPTPYNGYAPEWATLNYTMFRLGPNTFFTVRNEMFDDIVGERSGFNTIYSEHAIGLTYWPSKIICIRPELRFDHSYYARAYDLGTRHNQATAQFDVVFYF